MTRTRSTLRTAVAVAASALALALAACGSPADAGPSMQVWVLQDKALNPVQQKVTDTYNAGKPSVRAAVQPFANDPYKQKLQTAIGSPNAPDVFLNWGGGNLNTYVKAGNVTDLTAALDANPAFKNSFLPSVLDGGKINGRYYGVPMAGVQPVILFFNKDVLAKAGVTAPPATWAAMLAAIDRLKAAGVIPIALAGSQAWTELMWLEYLLERVGGPQVFADIEAGKPGAWSHPAVLTALTMIRDLVDRGAFGTSFGSVGQDSGGADALLAKGKAGMLLMGSWEYAGQLSTAPEFVQNGRLGWAPFPAVEGGKGDAKAVVGNPSNFFSVSAKSAHGPHAISYIEKTVTSPDYVSGLIKIGQVPAVAGLSAQLASGPNASYTTFVYDMVKDAPSFTQSWDQALDPATAQKMLTNLQQVFNKQISPQQFVTAMGT
ncbi:extracellular solute-binding protein [Longispora albida]|uniref:extracellular solute-binding protein n=1 Tax=Longispora albida TaxID=203523 RepID=UPI0003A2F911|nr:extracellular solute-binding protein [Longispora albida]